MRVRSLRLRKIERTRSNSLLLELRNLSFFKRKKLPRKPRLRPRSKISFKLKLLKKQELLKPKRLLLRLTLPD